MRSSWTATLAAGAAAIAMVVGIAVAKSHGPGGPPGHGKAYGSHRGPHGGGPGEHHRGGHGRGGGPVACEAAASTIGAFVDASCPCAGRDDGAGGTIAWKNHGQYVRCVTRAVRSAARSLGVKRHCGRFLVPCAARSTCGKRDAVACVVPVAGTCQAGSCLDDPALACTTDADCPSRECSVLPEAECAAAGGSGGSGSCCTASPSGAFLD